MSDEQSQSGGGAHVTIHAINGGSQAFGSHGKADSTNYTTVVADQAHSRLLTTVRELRRELGDGTQSPEDEEVVAALTEVEGEIARNGRGASGPLARLRDCLADYAPATATAAAVTAVLQALVPVLG
ncbi:hypothetical protein [Streptomyces flavofungini]|uniref:hypothetical protein n=1 Tax=Streptomyces flavofungini TaxID=68200 RepID=UPI0025B0224F|nr:hypothetical protein [Streptomyces flavofungini]WJV46687.1 hypothetical protein QUY26_14845 [Streptomyces flavofungini]